MTCEDLILTNGMVVYNDTTIPRAVGSTANYSCDTGYDLTLGDVRDCTATGWVGTVATCMGKLLSSPIKHSCHYLLFIPHSC